MGTGLGDWPRFFMRNLPEQIPVGTRVEVRDAETGEYVGWGRVVEHERVSDGYVTFVRMSDGSPCRVPFVVPKHTLSRLGDDQFVDKDGNLWRAYC